jgi:hypothetical protein
MGQKVSNFFSNVGKAVLKAGTTAVGSFIPYVGPTLATYINSKYKKGGKVFKFAKGGILENVPEGIKRKAINSVAGLRALVRQYPNEARLAGLSEEDLLPLQGDAGREEVHDLGYEGMGAGRKDVQYQNRKKGGMVDVPCCSHGVASLPASNLDRLNRYQSGGVAGGRDSGEQSFVVLQHGHPAERPRHHSKKFVS